MREGSHLYNVLSLRETWIIVSGFVQGDRRPLRTKLMFALCAFAMGGAALFYIYSQRLNYPVIRSDGQGYYAYLPGVLLYHDVTLGRLVNEVLDGVPPGGTAPWDATDRYLIKYPCGEAVLMLPFFGLGSALAYLFHQPLNGYSDPFQYAAAVSGLSYAIAGLLILWHILERYFSQKTILFVLIGTLFATNLFHYATYDAIFSHAYSFFLFSLFLYATERVYRKDDLSGCVLIGIAAGLILITRPTDGLWLLFGALFGICSLEDARDRLRYWLRRWRGLLLALAAAVALISLQLAYWRLITGSFVVYSYGTEGFDWSRPQVFNVLFSVRKGLFFWSPILLSVFPGMYYVRKMAAAYFLPIVVFFPINIYVISSWVNWWYGGSFGQRPFTESLPIFAIALCALYEGPQNKTWKRVVSAAILLACALSIWLMLKYWFGSIPFEGPTWTRLTHTFFQLRRH